MHRYRITTPEQVHFHYEVGGLASRGGAWLIDQLFITILRIALAMTLSQAGYLGLTMMLLGFFLLDFGYYTYFELKRQGQSPGKRYCNLRVIAAHGGRLTFYDVLLRNAMRAVDWLPFGMAAGGVTAFFDPLHRRLGDFVADTIVIRDCRQELPTAFVSGHDKVNSYAADPALRGRINARCCREDRDLLLDLMLRRDYLEPEVRETLFGQTAKYLREKLNLPEEDNFLSDEQTVLNVALVLQKGH